MPEAPHCSDTEVLRRFLLGRFPPDEVERLAGHVESCARCIDVLNTLADSPSARRRFVREGQAAAALSHDRVVPIYEVGEDRGVPFLAMPLLLGETLEDRLRRQAPLPDAEVLRVGRGIAEGLAAAHDK